MASCSGLARAWRRRRSSPLRRLPWDFSDHSRNTPFPENGRCPYSSRPHGGAGRYLYPGSTSRQPYFGLHGGTLGKRRLAIIEPSLMAGPPQPAAAVQLPPCVSRRPLRWPLPRTVLAAPLPELRRGWWYGNGVRVNAIDGAGVRGGPRNQGDPRQGHRKRATAGTRTGTARAGHELKFSTHGSPTPSFRLESGRSTDDDRCVLRLQRSQIRHNRPDHCDHKHIDEDVHRVGREVIPKVWQQLGSAAEDTRIHPRVLRRGAARMYGIHRLMICRRSQTVSPSRPNHSNALSRQTVPISNNNWAPPIAAPRMMLPELNGTSFPG